MAVDDAGGDPETEAGALEVFGGVEGLEDAGADGGGHAVASVGDGEADALRLGVVVTSWARERDEAASARTHGVDGVGDEVVEDLADVVFEAEDGAGGGVAGFDGMLELVRRPW